MKINLFMKYCDVFIVLFKFIHLLMYKTDFICTYQDVQNEEIINNKYRDDLLDILDLEIFDEKASEKLI